MLVTLGGLAFATPTYLDANARFGIPVHVTARQVRRQVRRVQRQTGREIRWVDGERVTPVLPPTPDGTRLGRLPEAAHIALLAALTLPLPADVEWDVLIRPTRGDVRPVTLWTAVEGTLTVAVGAPLPPRPAPTLEDALDQARAALEPDLQAFLAGISLERASRPPPGFRPRDAVARYVRSTHTIVIHDRALNRPTRFIGPVDAPHPPLVATLVHELGHALDDGRSSAALLEAMGDLQSAPTPYGRTSPAEAFADAFTLHVLDPAALRRASPAAAAWFDGPEWTASVNEATAPR